MAEKGNRGFLQYNIYLTRGWSKEEVLHSKRVGFFRLTKLQKKFTNLSVYRCFRQEILWFVMKDKVWM